MLKVNKLTDPYTQLDQVLNNLHTMITTVEGLQNDLLEALRENTELKIENKLLREKFNNIPEKHQEKTQDGMSGLKEIYQSGYHICNMYYGSHRVENEDCIFCLDIFDHQRGAGKKNNANSK
ncbi:DNA replication initiation control protein YabA [Amylolactobacillus amylophilus DSM 20533 = JCM 1125]|uniref:DNA replication initiation control protein YabA n=1 Tax=Amylolactobacillus amylophilus DSM 20533 = JCM 1125 TaxID=1423721 RepID=A0A1L6XE75_9LACO|nr:DNA replication initiation control protein YabA [Amylolactobacillus amylophilus DSM 20533 = JCM 1125]